MSLLLLATVAASEPAGTSEAMKAAGWDCFVENGWLACTGDTTHRGQEVEATYWYCPYDLENICAVGYAAGFTSMTEAATIADVWVGSGADNLWDGDETTGYEVAFDDHVDFYLRRFWTSTRETTIYVIAIEDGTATWATFLYAANVGLLPTGELPIFSRPQKPDPKEQITTEDWYALALEYDRLRRARRRRAIAATLVVTGATLGGAELTSAEILAWQRFIEFGAASAESPTAMCMDGVASHSQTRQGTCSGHGGVSYWF